jgi:hypothetical protein
LQVVVDEGLAVSGVIPTTGGSLTAQAADGTKYTLTLPEGALLSDEEIKLTPLASVEGLPFSGGLVGGAQMAPEGLRLFQPATLTIESLKTVAAEGFETVAFGYHQAGEGVYLTPSDVAGSILTLELWHFSGEAAAQATPPEIQTQQQQYVPSIAEDAFTQRMQEFIGRQRQADLMGEGNPDFMRQHREFLREAYNSFVAPQLPIALTDCERAPAILSRALGWAQQAELLGGSVQNEFRAEIDKVKDTYEKFKENCLQTWTGEGTYRNAASTSGIEMASAYTFQIAFRRLPDGTIAGSGMATKVDASYGGQGLECTDIGTSSLTFPPMSVSGTVNPPAVGETDATFQLTIGALPSTNTWQFECKLPLSGSLTLDEGIDPGFVLVDIEIAGMDGARANGEIESAMGPLGGGDVQIWELQIHRQATP